MVGKRDTHRPKRKIRIKGMDLILKIGEFFYKDYHKSIQLIMKKGQHHQNQRFPYYYVS